MVGYGKVWYEEETTAVPGHLQAATQHHHLLPLLPRGAVHHLHLGHLHHPTPPALEEDHHQGVGGTVAQEAETEERERREVEWFGKEGD